MSASPTIAASSTKRPLEEPSSPAGPNDQPDAKRPALDKMVKESEPITEDIEIAEPVRAESIAEEDVKDEAKPETTAEYDIAFQNGTKDGQADTVVPDAPPVNSILETQPIQSTSSANGRGGSHNQHQDETNWLHLRAVISTAEAATIIGKGGENVTQIRRMSGAKCTVSDYSRGAVERILTVSGQVDAVSKVNSQIIYVQIYGKVLTFLGIRSHRSHPQSGGHRGTVYHSVEVLPYATPYSSHSNRLDHWQGWCPHSRNPGSVKREAQCIRHHASQFW
jgi:poly(rC)-binding protein 2/3/4